MSDWMMFTVLTLAVIGVPVIAVLTGYGWFAVWYLATSVVFQVISIVVLNIVFRTHKKDSA
jgi:hypothetical protein